MPASTEQRRDERPGPCEGDSGLLGLSARALSALSEAAASELSSALIEAGQADQAWEVLRLSQREELLPQIAQKACSARQIECERFAELGALAARWAIDQLGDRDPERLGEALSELLVVRNGPFLARAQQEAGVDLLESLARAGAMFSNGMTLSNARRLSWAFDTLDERFERACLERDLSGPRMLLGCPGVERRKAENCAQGAQLAQAPEGGERRRFGGFGLLGLATGRHEPFKRALGILRAMGFDLAQELGRRTERRSYGGMDFPPHNCMTAALVSRNEANARLIMQEAPNLSPENEMRELMELMGPSVEPGCPERERQRLDFKRACALACALEIERSAGGASSGDKSSGSAAGGKKSRAL